jgi:cytochrome b6-f complex iron-sulfur subunit
MTTSNFQVDLVRTEPTSGQATASASGIDRREFLTYAWGAAMALLTAESALASYFFMLPRFRAGEFGGKFRLGPAGGLPASGMLPPQGYTAGKFWLVHTEEGVKALYMVCTHLGCLYKWSEANTRFECPCHGSKFTANGDYIEGPAPRSLDQFVIEVIDHGATVAVTAESPERILPPSISSQTADIIVDTGKRILGKPAETSPARREHR